ncbi:MAG: arginase family protein [Thiohalomonadaceae bacterium]
MFTRTCSVIDAPSDLGLRPTGVAGLPEALRAAGILEGLPAAAWAGRVAVPPHDPTPDAASGVLNGEGIAVFSRRLAERIAFTLDLGRFPLVLGGDCSILLGSMLALRRRGRFGLLFIDGHADFYSPEAEPAGEVASMDLALVTGHGPTTLTDADGLCPLVREEDVVVLGFRDADSACEYGSPDVRATSMQTFDLAEVRAMGAAKAARAALSTLEHARTAGFWIHLDADVLHDDVMPAVDYRIPDGLWQEELIEVLAAALASPRVVGMEITIYNPALDDETHSAARALSRAVTQAFALAAVR